MVPSIRIFRKNDAPLRGDGDFVLYWMIAARRTRWNFAMDRAAEWAAELGRPLLVFEPLRCDYRWASARIHRYVLDGMRDNARALAGSGIGYLPYVEPARSAGRGLLAALAERAAVVVTDESPAFFLPRMVAAAAERLDVRLESVDSNGLLPLAATGRAFHRAFDFRRFLQRELPAHLADTPRRSVRQGAALPACPGVAEEIATRWPAAVPELLDRSEGLDELPIDHGVAPVAEPGGYEAGLRALRRFVGERLDRYGEERNQPQAGASSELSAYLHFGHLSPHQVLDAIARREGWSPWRLTGDRGGERSGWWGLPASIESLPDWALRTLREHAGDARPAVYRLEELERAATHDELWNAAQRELLERGRIHSYLRMLWGKKILHWTRSPREAHDAMVELNNKYAIDGRDPNSTSGISWVLGRFDRAWGPERPVFGKVRYMSSRATRRKLRVDGYLERWARP